jgi:hypothetical protein
LILGFGTLLHSIAPGDEHGHANGDCSESLAQLGHEETFGLRSLNGS